MKAIGLIVIALLGVAGPASFADETTGPVELTLPQLGGGEVSLSGLRGQWVVLNYWATWCAPCRKEIPDLSALHDAREDINVLGLTFEDVTEADLVSFLELFKPSYPILLVDVLTPPEPFGAPRVLPTSIIIGPQGTVEKTFVGPVTGEQIEAAIEAAGPVAPAP